MCVCVLPKKCVLAAAAKKTPRRTKKPNTLCEGRRRAACVRLDDCLFFVVGGICRGANRAGGLWQVQWAEKKQYEQKLFSWGEGGGVTSRRRAAAICGRHLSLSRLEHKLVLLPAVDDLVEGSNKSEHADGAGDPDERPVDDPAAAPARRLGVQDPKQRRQKERGGRDADGADDAHQGAEEGHAQRDDQRDADDEHAQRGAHKQPGLAARLVADAGLDEFEQRLHVNLVFCCCFLCVAGG